MILITLLRRLWHKLRPPIVGGLRPGMRVRTTVDAWMELSGSSERFCHAPADILEVTAVYPTCGLVLARGPLPSSGPISARTTVGVFYRPDQLVQV